MNWSQISRWIYHSHQAFGYWLMRGTSQSRDKDTPPHACFPLCLCWFFGFLIWDSDVPIVPCFGFWEYKWYPQQLQLFLPKRLRNTRSISESGWADVEFLVLIFSLINHWCIEWFLVCFLGFPFQATVILIIQFIHHIHKPMVSFLPYPQPGCYPKSTKNLCPKSWTKKPTKFSRYKKKHIHTKSLPNCWFEPPIWQKNVQKVKIEQIIFPNTSGWNVAIFWLSCGSPNYPRVPWEKNLSLIVFQLSSRKRPKATPISLLSCASWSIKTYKNWVL